MYHLSNVPVKVDGVLEIRAFFVQCLYGAQTNEFFFKRLSYSEVVIARTGEQPSIKVLASFYVTSELSRVNGKPIRKEKFNVPVDKEVHNELHKFKMHFAKFFLINEIAKTKGLDENPEITFEWLNKLVGCTSVEEFSIQSRDSWQHEFPKLVDGNGMVQSKSDLLYNIKLITTDMIWSTE